MANRRLNPIWLQAALVIGVAWGVTVLGYSLYYSIAALFTP